jgi:flagellar basal-body rod protein FlgF
MDRLIYVAMTGAREAMRAQTIVSHNLANVGTTGFRALRHAVEATPVPGGGFESRINPVGQPETWDGATGVMTDTGRDLDVAVQGAGWIAVQAANGEEAYTRAGNLRINTSGLLETATGQLVLGNGGPISLPEYQQLFVGDDGQLSLVGKGETPDALVQVDRIKLVNPPPEELMHSADGLFRMKDGSAAPADANVRIASGQLESSNVNPAQALVDMIELSRAYEMQVRAMHNAEENDAAASRLMRNGG